MVGLIKEFYGKIVDIILELKGFTGKTYSSRPSDLVLSLYDADRDDALSADLVPKAICRVHEPGRGAHYHSALSFTAIHRDTQSSGARRNGSTTLV